MQIKEFFKNNKYAGYVIAGVVGSFVSIAAVAALWGGGNNGQYPNAESQLARYASLNSSPAFDFTGVSAIATPAVVHIKTTMSARQSQRGGGGNPFEQFFGPDFDFQMPQQGPSQATGSGVIIAQDGLIVTNNHVIENATKIEVTLNDKRTYIADLVGTDKNTDIAVLRIAEKDLPYVKLGNSEDAKVGQWVVAVGNPFNLNSTVTLGIISAVGRNIDLLRSQGNQYAIENFIQTDAAINPGNSGGALINTAGELLGINTAIASQTGSYAGYGFAVPSNLVSKIVKDLEKYGKVQRALLGVQIQDVSQQLMEEKGLSNLKGVYVPEVIKGGAGERGGIKGGDVILAINNHAVNSSSSLQEEIGKYRPGDKVNIKIRRKGDEKDIQVILLAADGSAELTKASAAPASDEFMGLSIKNMTSESRRSLGLKNGVLVADVQNGPFKAAGIPEGFVITHIANEPIYSTTGALNIFKQINGATTLEGKTKDGEDKIFAIKIVK
jgi:Do/DeqQ family serine protease